jgi:hypothetical protein
MVLYLPLHQLHLPALSIQFYPLALFFQWTLFFLLAQKVQFVPSYLSVQ